jgi:hypothetical protein
VNAEIACLCGNLRLRINAPPQVGFWCHCADCRAAHGAAYVGIALYDSDAVAVVSGKPATLTIRTLPRAFCSACGTRLFARVPETPTTGVVAARLPEGTFAPSFHVHCAEALAPVRDDLPHFFGLPAVFGGEDRLADW